MGKINLLSPSVANLIAAGEVVDRPASAVKELLENAIDSGADTITVEIQRGGVSFIRVADNGCGIEKEDLAPAITRHSTSKISTAADLAAIFTLGFRGEALAAIAAVSKLRIFSKVPGAPMGALLEAEGGQILSVTDAGCREGTTIIVEDLFHNVPARRKFLKKDATEAAAIGAVVEKIALSRPDIGFKYISDGEIKFMTTGKGDLRETVFALFGKDLAKRSLAVDREEGGIRVSGFISEPDLYRSNRNMENFFINGRYIKSKTASAALEQAYSSKIPHDKFPFCVLNITLNPAAVDVNVHPAKLEVKFTNEKIIFDAVYYAVLSALEAAPTRPELLFGAAAARDPQKDRRGTSYANAFLPQDQRHRAKEQLRLGETQTRSKAHSASYSISDMFPPAEDPQDFTPQEANRVVYESIKRAGVYVQDTLAHPAEDDRTPAQRAKEAMESLHLPENAIHVPSQSHAPVIPMPGDEDAPPAPYEAEVPYQGGPSFGAPASTVIAADPVETAPTIADRDSAPACSFPLPAVEEIGPGDVPEYFILGEAFNCYVIVQIADRLLMIDKHAAHERILFDELCRKMRASVFSGQRGGQLLLTPLTVELLSPEADALADYQAPIEALGFAWNTEKTGVSTVRVHLTSIPEGLDSGAATELFNTLANGLSQSTASVESAAQTFFETRLWQAACKAAIKGGRVYDMGHIRWICDRLLKKPDGDNQVIRVCPHGRPVAFEIKKSSIDRQFARLV